MAGDWIKMNKSLPRDPRVVRISSALKADRLRTVGGLLSAWCLFDEQTEDGKLDGYTPELMDEIIGMAGLARAMESVGWLTVDDGFLIVPRFGEHNGQSAKRRAQDSVRKMSAREADKCPQSKKTKSGLEKRRIEKSIPPIPPEGEAMGEGEMQLPGMPEPTDPPPKLGRCLPDGWRKLGETQKQRMRVNFNTPTMILIGKSLGRKETTLWTVQEAEALMNLKPSEDEIDAILKFYGADIHPDQDRRRQNLITLLNNWNGELDKSRLWKAEQRQRASA